MVGSPQTSAGLTDEPKTLHMKSTRDWFGKKCTSPHESTIVHHMELVRPATETIQARDYREQSPKAN